MEECVSIINGISLWYVKQGQGTPVVLLHGGPGAYDYLAPVAGLLSDRYLVIRYDQRGSWRSEKKGPYDIATFIEDLEQLRIHLGLERWIVGGHSWGASLALAYAVQHPARVMALIYISGTGIDPGWHADYRVNRLNRMSSDDREEYAKLRSVMDTLSGEKKSCAIARVRELSLRADLVCQDQYEAMPQINGHYINNEVNRTVGSECDQYFENVAFKQDVSRVTAPALFLHGEMDPRPYNYSLALSRLLPSAHFCIIQKAGHYPWLDNPSMLGAEMNAFLQRLFP
ncbi:Proline iminopeptidase [Paenibacillus solanacearum]|uniref:Proline iminopeptidase n=1 Tax=Paenibacillus solanacearum TaxID=2048548 RepID=A0A916NKZ9_9BACL|nr:alpha/beta hydrolase [Paenibacillus solanacearum]CAG7599852.1 Proline iminopeptidase [Paenibacillus solanacearum]